MSIKSSHYLPVSLSKLPYVISTAMILVFGTFVIPKQLLEREGDVRQNKVDSGFIHLFVYESYSIDAFMTSECLLWS